jgi:hypothetical protein
MVSIDKLGKYNYLIRSTRAPLGPPMASAAPDPDPPPDFQDEVVAFKALVGSLFPPPTRSCPSQFVKKLDQIPEVSIPSTTARRKALSFASRELVGQFMGLWPSPRQIDLWIERNWHPLVQGRMNHFFCGKGFYIFISSLNQTEILFSETAHTSLGQEGYI